jgi:hypothetical protein
MGTKQDSFLLEVFSIPGGSRITTPPPWFWEERGDKDDGTLIQHNK